MAQTQDRPVLRIERHYAVGPEKVWQAWTEPQALSRWFGPGEPGSVTDAQLEVRPGGRYSIAFRTPDGDEHRVSGVYEEVVANRKLRFSWAWQSTPDRVSLVTIELSPNGTGTDMLLHHERFFDQAARDNHVRGWAATIAKLDSFLAN
jgi:uncharacterized protein YndB with AHSA1/START domain